MKHLYSYIVGLIFLGQTAFAQSINVEHLEDNPRDYPKTVVTVGVYTNAALSFSFDANEYSTAGVSVSGMHVFNDDLDIYANVGIGLGSSTLDVEPYVQYYFYERQMKRRYSTLIGSNPYTNTYLRTQQEQLIRIGGRGGYHHLNRGFTEFDLDENSNDPITSSFTTGSLFVGAVLNGRRCGKYNAEGVGLVDFANDINIYVDVMAPIISFDNTLGSNSYNTNLGWRIGLNNRVQANIGSFKFFISYQGEVGRFSDFVLDDTQRATTIRAFAGFGFGF